MKTFPPRSLAYRPAQGHRLDINLALVMQHVTLLYAMSNGRCNSQQQYKICLECSNNHASALVTGHGCNLAYEVSYYSLHHNTLHYKMTQPLPHCDHERSTANASVAIVPAVRQHTGSAVLNVDKPPAQRTTWVVLVQASRIEDIPGKDKSMGDVVLEQAEGVIQKFSPFSRIHQHVCGFHFYAHDMTRQVTSCCICFRAENAGTHENFLHRS